MRSKRGESFRRVEALEYVVCFFVLELAAAFFADFGDGLVFAGVADDNGVFA
jgi:hypothetical protein